MSLNKKGGEEIITPNVILAYIYFQNIFSVFHLLNEYKKANCLAIHCAVRRKTKSLIYFHHFIITSIVKINDFYELTVIHKAGASIGSTILFSAIGFGTEFCKIKQEKIVFDARNGQVIKDKENLMNFKIGRFYVLGDYTVAQRKNCFRRAKEQYEKKSRDYYSLESANCEHFVTYCFEGIGKSFQSDIRKKQVAQGDIVIDLFSDATKDGLKNGAVAGAKAAGDKVAKTVILQTPKIVTHKAGQAVHHATVKAVPIGYTVTSLGIGAAIGTGVEIGATLYQCHKIKKLYKNKQMSEEDMKTEIKKQVSSAVGGVSLGLAAGAAGAVIGSFVCPFLGTSGGFVIGNFAGNIAGKIAGHAVAKKI